MIQRIQTIYLLLSAIAMVVCLCFDIALFEGPALGDPLIHMKNLCIVDGQGTMRFVVAGLAVVLIAAIILSILNIFGYKDLKKQSRQCLLTIILQILWIGGFAIMLNEMCPEGYTRHIEIPACLPIIAIIFQWLARRSIRHDIKILKAADRIR